MHKLKDSKMLSPFDIPLDKLRNVQSKKVTWRIYFNLVKALKKEKVLTGWTYMAQSTRKINNKETFGIFADKTFSKNDTVGFLHGKVIYTQENATEKIPEPISLGQAPNKNLNCLDLLKRDAKYRWTVQRVFLVNEIQQVDL